MTYRLSKAQNRVASNIEHLLMCFDVYRGYWYEIKVGDLRQRVSERTVESLRLHKVIVEGKDKRVVSGYRETSFALTEYGKSLITSEGV